MPRARKGKTCSSRTPRGFTHGPPAFATHTISLLILNWRSLRSIRMPLHQRQPGDESGTTLLSRDKQHSIIDSSEELGR